MKCKLYPKYECPEKKWNPMTGFLRRLTPPPCDSCTHKLVFKLTEENKTTQVEETGQHVDLLKPYITCPNCDDDFYLSVQIVDHPKDLPDHQIVKSFTLYGETRYIVVKAES